MSSNVDRWWTNARLATFAPGVAAPYGAMENHAIGVKDGRIVAIVPSSEVRGQQVTDVGGRWITPGLIDCHTHLIYGGNRSNEWEMRLNGVPYAEIARQGGGILNTVRATRNRKMDELAAEALPRLRAVYDCARCKSSPV